MADKYLLRVTAGPSYDPSTHKIVPVNTPTPSHISSPLCDASISVKIQNYRGLPHNSPSTSPYFTQAPHTHDQYSISFALLPHRPIRGSSLLFGNDFDQPIRDRLPPGFGTALRILKWGIDPGLDGDVYSDTPYLYGNALSSVNVLRVGEKVKEGGGLPVAVVDGKALEEGGDGEGVGWRASRGVPETGEARKKHFLGKGRTEEWVWEEGRVYMADFFNPYLDFNEFAIKLPGFSLSVLPYLGGADYLRYVLKDKDNDGVLFVVVFTLLHKQDVKKEEEEAEAEAEAVKAGQPSESGVPGLGSDKHVEIGENTRHEGEKSFQPQADDLD